jgi:5-methylcytosine-specific restriction endonuclease McrA
MKHLFPEKPPLQQKKPRGRPKSETPKKRKEKIPAAVYEAIWTIKMGKVFQGKCLTTWCPNTITVFDFQAGHDIPESKGGPASVENLYPICARCNQSMGDRYTFKEWCAMSPSLTLPQTPPPVVQDLKKPWFCWCF